MSWYNEERDGKTKKYLEWALGVEIEPEDEAGFYKPKDPTKRINRDKYKDDVVRYVEGSEEP